MKEICTSDVLSENNIPGDIINETKNEVYYSDSCKCILSSISSTSSCRKYTFKKTIPFHANLIKNKKFKHTDSDICSQPQSSYDDTCSTGIVLNENSHSDLRDVLEKVIPSASSEMIDMLLHQKQNLARNPKGRRWYKKSVCLSGVGAAKTISNLEIANCLYFHRVRHQNCWWRYVYFRTVCFSKMSYKPKQIMSCY